MSSKLKIVACLFKIPSSIDQNPDQIVRRKDKTIFGPTPNPWRFFLYYHMQSSVGWLWSGQDKENVTRFIKKKNNEFEPNNINSHQHCGFHPDVWCTNINDSE